jgi:hypothetical protein
MIMMWPVGVFNIVCYGMVIVVKRKPVQNSKNKKGK